jgi:uncharacterized protein (TIGR03000 family)
MVRHWFSLTAVLAVAVLIVVTDASQSRERRLLGRRARRNADTSVVYGPTWSGPYYYDSAGQLVPGTVDDKGVASMPTEGRPAFYPPENGSMRARPVLLVVRAPADAEIVIEGAKTMAKGTVRQFISPPLEPGRHYTYEIKAKWMDNGREVTRTQKLDDVRPGARLNVDLTKPSEERQQ